jgi:hypothetical protein
MPREDLEYVVLLEVASRDSSMYDLRAAELAVTTDRRAGTKSISKE